MTGPVAPSGRPRLLSGVRTHFDKVRNSWMLLAPERALVLDPIAVNILEEVDGKRTFVEVVDALAAKFDAPRERIEADVGAFLATLSERRMLEIDP